MISYEISSIKPEPKPQQQEAPVISNNGRVYPISSWAGDSNTIYLSPSCTEQEFADYKEKLPFKEGDFVCSSHMPYSPTSLAQISYVAFEDTRCPTFTLATWERQHPKIFTMIGLATGTVTPWIRRESVVNYRKLTNEEYNRIVKDSLDSIRDRIKPYTQHQLPA
jgi:hypothetical protein